MTRHDLVARAKAILATAYEEAAYLIAEYLDRHPSEQLQSLCKEIDRENWDALRKRVQRAQTARNTSNDEGSSRTPEKTKWEKDRERAARQVIRESTPEEFAELLDTPGVRAKLTRALDAHYSKEIGRTKDREREREIERHGGEAELAEQKDRQRVMEVINVVRGAASGFRFAIEQSKRLGLSVNHPDLTPEIRSATEETVTYATMLTRYLDGHEFAITDEDIRALLEAV